MSNKRNEELRKKGLIDNDIYLQRCRRVEAKASIKMQQLSLEIQEKEYRLMLLEKGLLDS